MNIPYRVRRGLQRFFVTLGVLTLVAAVAMGAWMLWLNRYVIYTEDGAKLDFNSSFAPSDGELAKPPAATESVPISYGNTDELIALPSDKLGQVAGYTISVQMLTENLAGVKAAVEQLPVGTALLMDVKNLQGGFYYTSSLGKAANKVDTASITQFIQDLDGKGYYLIARFPAFRDRQYFLDDEAGRVPYGLPRAGGKGSLWEDKSVPNSNHYWFNPATTGTQNFLVQIINELSNLGFDEVLLEDFRFPNTDKITFSDDKTEALNECAKVLAKACAGDGFVVSFADSQIALPEGHCRLYLEDVAAGDIPALVSSMTLENPNTQLVFLTDLMDTRYDAYGVLRPLPLT